MSRRRLRPGFAVLTFALAIMLMLIPLPDALQWFRPYWVAMVLIYWNIEAADSIGMGVGFGVGLLVDLATGTLLGVHALGLVIVAYIVSRFRLRMRFFPLWQQALVVGAILLNDRLIYAWILSLSGFASADWRVIWAPLVAVLVWPWLFILLDRTHRHVGVK